MDLKTFIPALPIARDYFLYEKADPSIIEYVPQKTEIFSSDTKKEPHPAPESVGVNSFEIISFLSELESNRNANIHSVVISLDGKIICDASAPGYNSKRWHLTHSMCKSITSLAIGMLIDDKKLTLDTTLFDIFGKDALGAKRLTVRNLLEMSACGAFAEAGSVSSLMWTSEFFAQDYKEAGENFKYNSMNSYMLSRIVAEISGFDLFDFLLDRLFTPLEIKNVFWEKSPEGFSKGGFGLFISARDALKIGEMCANGGVYKGKRIISEEYLKTATTAWCDNPNTESDYNYGLHIWVNRNNRSYLFNGMLGQNVWICPENKMVIAATSGNDELFQTSALMEILKKHFDPEVFSPAAHMKANRAAYKALTKRETEFFRSRTFAVPLKTPTLLQKIGAALTFRRLPLLPYEAKLLDGKTYEVMPTNAGIVPLMIRVMQNSYSKGLNKIAFNIEGDKFFVTFTEGDVVYKLEVGLFAFKDNVVVQGEEKYSVKLLGEFTESEDRIKMLKLDMLFNEMPNTRRISFYFDTFDKIRVNMTEIPSKKMLSDLLQGMDGPMPKRLSMLALVNPLFNIEVIKSRLQSGFAPTLTAVCEGSGMLPSPEPIIQEEQIKI